jgi:uroporphyrinogen decarboxylase
MKKVIQVLQGHKFDVPPIWLMRQAGRYLPEYRAIRTNYSDFMGFCFDSKAIQTVTLQPIERFDFDAAIIFSDILVIPHILGQKVRFEKDHGPVLSDVNWQDLIAYSDQIDMPTVMQPITNTIQEIRAALKNDKALFGFVGSPWTIATYMISRGKTQDFDQIKPFVDDRSGVFEEIIDILTKKTTQWLQLQIDAGCDVVQIFDSWAGMVPEEKREQILFTPLRNILSQLKQSHPHVPVVYFGKGISSCYPYISEWAKDVAFGVDQHADIAWVHSNLKSEVAIQGNLDPISLRDGTFENQVQQLKYILKDRPYVFNLGHGILPDTPIENVERLIYLVRS